MLLQLYEFLLDCQCQDRHLYVYHIDGRSFTFFFFFCLSLSLSLHLLVSYVCVCCSSWLLSLFLSLFVVCVFLFCWILLRSGFCCSCFHQIKIRILTVNNSRNDNVRNGKKSKVIMLKIVSINFRYISGLGGCIEEIEQ